MTAKHSGLAVLLLLGLLILWGWYCRIRTGGKNAGTGPDSKTYHGHLISEARWWGTRGIVILLVSALVVWTVYRFETGRLLGFPWVIPFPSHIESLRALFESKERIAFLRGQLREGGWWWYSPYVFLVKTPLPLLLAIVLSLCDGVRRLLRIGCEMQSRLELIFLLQPVHFASII